MPSLSIIWKAQGQTRHHTLYIIPMLISNLCRGLDYDVEAPFLRWLYASSAGKIPRKCAFPLTTLSEARDLWLEREWGCLEAEKGYLETPSNA